MLSVSSTPRFAGRANKLRAISRYSIPQPALTDLALAKSASSASMLSPAISVERGLARAAMISPCRRDGTTP